jgi:hypothetical protein
MTGATNAKTKPDTEPSTGMLGIVLAASLAAGLLFPFAAFAEGTTADASATASQSTAPQTSEQRALEKKMEAWRASMEKASVQKNGCFTASFPSAVWQEVPCTTAPNHPHPPLSISGRAVSIPKHNAPNGLSGPSTVGNGHDYAAEVTSGLISSATGSFDSVAGVESEADHGNANVYSLQLNSNNFTSPTCSTAAVPSACQGWEQFVFEGSGGAFVQYWLLDYAKTCPSGWNTLKSDCWRNAANAVSVPAQPITSLAKLRLTGQAVTGGSDTITMSTASSVFKATNPDSALALAKGWRAAEFNLFGNDGGSQADLNSGVTIDVRTTVNNSTQNAPTCEANGGTTGETSNLNLGSCSAVGGSAPAIKFTENNPPGSIWKYTGTPCNGSSCTGWQELDDNGESVRIAVTGSNLYQLWNTGEIWQSTGTPCNSSGCPGWKSIDNNGATLEIVAGGGNLYKLHNTGQIFTYTGSSWQMLDDNPAAVTIAASTGHLYELHNTGKIWRYTGTPCNGNSCPGWQQLDGNPATIAIVTEGSNLYQLHSGGTVWKYTGTPCNSTGCPGWQLLNNNPAATVIAASGGNLYELDNTGKIWRYTGTPCNGSSCTGWKMLDDNPAAMDIAADGSNLYQLHNTGRLWKFTGTACTGTSCPGWQMLDDNAWTGRIAATNGNLYQLHVIETPPAATLECYECR